MALAIFKAFQSTVTRWYPKTMTPREKWLVDANTGAIVGIQNDNAGGPDTRFVPVDITAAQALSPSPDMIADLDATYRLNVPPYTRYQSDGAQLVTLAAGGTESQNLVPAGVSQILYAPLTVTSSFIVQGQVSVRSLPA